MSFDEAFDKRNAIDYFIFLQFLHLPDNMESNVQIVSYDGQKWFFLPYDLDFSLGISWDGTGQCYTPNAILIDKTSERFWGKVYNAFSYEIEERYAELRRKDVLSVDAVYRHIKERAGGFTEELVAAEYEKWPDKPNNTGHVQILEWLCGHILYLDKWFLYRP